jgi:hypothetical protein
MKHAYGVGIVLLLALGLASKPAQAQSTPSSSPPRVQLKQNYPNPFNPETKISFSLSESLFKDGKPVKVTLKIYNQLAQYVATFVALDHPRGNGAVIDHLDYTAAGDYVAYWDGYDRFHHKVASGLYIARLEVNGERSQTIRMIVAN